jgi:hypothetical protein
LIPLFSGKNTMGNNAKLDAFGDELEAMVTSMSKDPTGFFKDPTGPQLTRLKGLLADMQAAGQQQLAEIVAESKSLGETAEARAVEMEEGRKQAEAARKAEEEAEAAAAQQPAWPPVTGGLPLTFWLEKEFSPPEDEIQALIASLLGADRPTAPSANGVPRISPGPNASASPRPGPSLKERYEARSRVAEAVTRR